MKRTIESALKLFRFCGSRPVFIVVFLTLFGLSVQGMLAGPWLVIVSTVAGVAFGAVHRETSTGHCCYDERMEGGWEMAELASASRISACKSTRKLIPNQAPQFGRLVEPEQTRKSNHVELYNF